MQKNWPNFQTADLFDFDIPQTTIQGTSTSSSVKKLVNVYIVIYYEKAVYLYVYLPD